MRSLRFPFEQVVTLPGTVNIYLLGTFQLFIQQHRLPISRGSKAENLLIHLALSQERRLARNELLEYLWPEHNPTLAGQSLNNLVHQLNKRIRQDLGERNMVIHDDGYYTFNPSDEVTFDLDYFETWQQRGKAAWQADDVDHGLAYYEQALTLYRGDLCNDTKVATIKMVLERERLRTSLLDLLSSLGDHYLARDPMRALSYIHRLLNHEPCREDAHRLAMRCYMRLGARAQALRQYQFCCQILRTEFAASPEPATNELFEQIRLTPADLQQP